MAKPDTSPAKADVIPVKADFRSRFRQSRYFTLTIWTLRVVIGGVFVMSGLVKAIDIWGFLFKIEEYLSVWGMTQPRSVILLATIMISGYEFVFGALLATGCYKRVSAWALTAMMAVMLPLTLYLAVANPVSDCGCFGEFWVISNTATFLKNLLLTAALVVLCISNGKFRRGVYRPAIQWIVAVLLSVFIVIVALYGYNVQPMADFRPYPAGTSIVPDDSEDEGEMLFIYEKDGEQKEFSADELPDSTWTFVDRKNLVPKSADGELLTIYDREGNDVTDAAISSEGRQLLLVIPEPRMVDISYTYFLNELKQWADTSDVAMVCLIADDRRAMDFWQDVSMASYDIYGVEDTKLKELSRGTMSLVELDNGVIKSKYALSSIRNDIISEGPKGKDLLERMAPDPGWWLRTLSGTLVALLLLVYIFQRLILAINSRIRRFYQKKHVNLHPEKVTPTRHADPDDDKK